MNKVDKGSGADVTHQKSKLYPIQFQRRRINFEVGLLCFHVPTCDTQGGASFDTSIICTNLVEVH